MRRLLTRAGFERWLRGFKPGEIVGQRRRAESCPLAQYIKAECGYDWTFIDGWTYELREPRTPLAVAVGPHHESTPKWAERVIDAVDHGGSGGTAVTALEVRRILRAPVFK